MEGVEGQQVDVTVIGCDRCEGNHDPIAVYPLTKPSLSEGHLLTHYGHCPNNDEPFFVRFTGDDDSLAELLAGTLKGPRGFDALCERGSHDDG